MVERPLVTAHPVKQVQKVVYADQPTDKSLTIYTFAPAQKRQGCGRSGSTTSGTPSDPSARHSWVAPNSRRSSATPTPERPTGTPTTGRGATRPNGSARAFRTDTGDVAEAVTVNRGEQA
jgi:hypothetical protein